MGSSAEEMILQKKGHRQFQCVWVSNQIGRWQKSNQSVTLSLPRRDRSMLSLRVQDSWIARVPTMYGHRHDHYNVLADNIIMCVHDRLGMPHPTSRIWSMCLSSESMWDKYKGIFQVRYLVNNVGCQTEAIANEADYTNVPHVHTCINEQGGQPTDWLWCRFASHSHSLQVEVREAIPKKDWSLVQSHNHCTCNTN